MGFDMKSGKRILGRVAEKVGDAFTGHSEQTTIRQGQALDADIAMAGIKSGERLGLAGHAVDAIVGISGGVKGIMDSVTIMKENRAHWKHENKMLDADIALKEQQLINDLRVLEIDLERFKAEKEKEIEHIKEIHRHDESKLMLTHEEIMNQQRLRHEEIMRVIEAQHEKDMQIIRGQQEQIRLVIKESYDLLKRYQDSERFYSYEFFSQNNQTIISAINQISNFSNSLSQLPYTNVLVYED